MSCSRNVSDSVRRLAKASIIAAPFVFQGCAGAKEANRQPPIVVIDVAKAKPSIPEPLSEEPRSVKKTEPIVTCQTYLDISTHDDKTLQAYLSVVCPDHSFDRIILDPKVTFFYQTDSKGMKPIPGCASVPTCEIPKSKKDRTVTFKAEYAPESGVPLNPSVSEPYAWYLGQSERSVY